MWLLLTKKKVTESCDIWFSNNMLDFILIVYVFSRTFQNIFMTHFCYFFFFLFLVFISVYRNFCDTILRLDIRKKISRAKNASAHKSFGFLWFQYLIMIICRSKFFSWLINLYNLIIYCSEIIKVSCHFFSVYI